MKPLAVVIISGGLDSTTLLYYAKSKGYDVIAVTFDYGQKHSIEIDRAMEICYWAHVKDHIFLDVPRLMGSALTDKNKEIPKGDYSVETQKITVVPNRNMIFLALAANVAIAKGAEVMMYGAHKNDHAVYPDCRPQFVESMQNAINDGNYETLRIEAPFINMTKAEIVKLGSELKVPFSKTWSCYDPQEIGTGPDGGIMTHCGECGTCKERKEAFRIAEVNDPTAYASGVGYWKDG